MAQQAAAVNNSQAPAATGSTEQGKPLFTQQEIQAYKILLRQIRTKIPAEELRKMDYEKACAILLAGDKDKISGRSADEAGARLILYYILKELGAEIKIKD
ncbi:MAG: hypothetical protein NTZ10_04780, partial [Candidatus Saganbacteria bacterium]|nr:hypothetical protein [Candidatus Saganbacteria bacterium]